MSLSNDCKYINEKRIDIPNTFCCSSRVQIIKALLLKFSSMFSRAFLSSKFRKASQSFLFTPLKRKFTTELPNPKRTSRLPKWFMWTLGGLLGFISVSATMSWYKLKRILLLKRYLSEEELKAVRELAQVIIKEQNYNLTLMGIATLGPNLMTPFIPLTIERESTSNSDVRNLNQDAATREAKELFSAWIGSDESRKWKAGANFVLYYVYPQEDIQLILNDPDTRMSLMKGRLPTAEELERMREQQESGMGSGYV